MQSHFSSKVPVKAFSTFLLISSLFTAKIFSQSAIFFYPGLSFLHISYVIFKPVIVPLFKLVHPVLHSCFGVFFPRPNGELVLCFKNCVVFLYHFSFSVYPDVFFDYYYFFFLSFLLCFDCLCVGWFHSSYSFNFKVQWNSKCLVYWLCHCTPVISYSFFFFLMIPLHLTSQFFLCNALCHMHNLDVLFFQ